jgi:hypothetical protein
MRWTTASRTEILGFRCPDASCGPLRHRQLRCRDFRLGSRDGSLRGDDILQASHAGRLAEETPDRAHEPVTSFTSRHVWQWPIFASPVTTWRELAIRQPCDRPGDDDGGQNGQLQSNDMLGPPHRQSANVEMESGARGAARESLTGHR